MFKPQPISATEARKYFSQIINKVQFSSKSFVVKNYRRPAVRIVKEQYIAVLEEVIGKKTVAQIQQFSSDDNLPEFTKVQEIKKVFQRRLSGGSRPERNRGAGAPRPERRPERPQPPPKTPPQKQIKESNSLSPHKTKEDKSVAATHASPADNNRQRKGGGEILLKGGRNYA